MKTKTLLKPLLLLLCSAAVGTASAQVRPTFPAYSAYVSQVYDVKWESPKGFTEDNDVLRPGHWRPNGQKGTADLLYNFIFCSSDSNCLMMYPEMIPFMADQFLNIKWMILHDCGMASYDEAEFNSQVKTLMDSEANTQLNADTIYIGVIPLDKPYQDKYPYCTGVYVCKQDRPHFFFKCFFTEEGKRNEAVYLSKLFKAIKYRHADWTYDRDKELSEYQKMRANSNK